MGRKEKEERRRGERQGGGKEKGIIFTYIIVT